MVVMNFIVHQETFYGVQTNHSRAHPSMVSLSEVAIAWSFVIFLVLMLELINADDSFPMAAMRTRIRSTCARPESRFRFTLCKELHIVSLFMNYNSSFIHTTR